MSDEKRAYRKRRRADLEAEPVQPIRILGEDLTLFRMESGEFGLVGPRCAHRERHCVSEKRQRRGAPLVRGVPGLLRALFGEVPTVSRLGHVFLPLVVTA